MIPVVTPEEMAAIDAAATESVDVLIGRAAAAVRNEVVDLLGGTYGRRVLVLAGRGNNGNDGRVAAELLERRGVRTRVLGVEEVGNGADDPWAGVDPASFDLIVDAAFGTGFRGTWDPPPQGGAAVLAVDIPSGIDGLTGDAAGTPWRAVRTVTFAALKPGLLQADGPSHSGEVVVADIGLDTSSARAHLVTGADVVEWVPARSPGDHKWSHAVWVVAGSPGMEGAGWLCARAAMRAGSGYARVSSPGVRQPRCPLEAVGTPLTEQRWGSVVAAEAGRFGALVVGPGIGRDEQHRDQIEQICAAGVPVVLDADALVVLGSEPLAGATAPRVLTPHDREYEALMGHPPGRDRLEAARTAAARHSAVVLLKGPTTVVADPHGEVLVVRAGDERLATAGTGDVLSGTIGAAVAAGADPFRAAAAAARLQGAALELLGRHGVVAGDVAEALGEARSLLEGG